MKHKLCPYCLKRPLLKKTCGARPCQYKHHILVMRKRKRKTNQVRPAARVQL